MEEHEFANRWDGFGERGFGGPDQGAGVYGISVAAELSGIGEQSLRLYEQRRLITPTRTARRHLADTATTTSRGCSASPTCSPKG